MPPKIDYKRCNGCKICYDDCPGDIISWDEEKDLPVILYPDECWYCGNCELHCPQECINITLSPRFF